MYSWPGWSAGNRHALLCRMAGVPISLSRKRAVEFRQKGRTQPAADGRHFGLVVDDKDAVRKALADAGVKPLPGPFLDFLDPWGNRIEIVGYENIQFTKAPNILRGMGLTRRPDLTSGLTILAFRARDRSCKMPSSGGKLWSEGWSSGECRLGRFI